MAFLPARSLWRGSATATWPIAKRWIPLYTLIDGHALRSVRDTRRQVIREIEFVLTLSKEGLGTSAPSIFKCASAPVSFPYRPWALCCSAWFGGLSTMENFVQWMNERIKERRQQVLKAHKHKHRPGDVVYPVCNVQVQCYTNHALLFT